MTIEILELTISDYDDAIALWESCTGVSIRDADSRENIARYLNRNPGLNFKAIKNEKLVGTILCGHDGRRGYINHLAVCSNYRTQGIGRKLVETSLGELKKQGIEKCHLFVFVENIEAKKFWERLGWKHREEINMMSLSISDSANP
ncbi:GCN5-related N-acetyltransferase [Calothrix parasitica NIES-267]|uniref:GCN5-related N-acetyltransferase n=1 Tax=Calothrix parasitica NIES-267 TaxID=1973488 RepID=A0A1Z4LYD4_9CYAN|nr:GCN5-related N-acetyltransferase [Calothrix parasitica NIES-267]